MGNNRVHRFKSCGLELDAFMHGRNISVWNLCCRLADSGNRTSLQALRNFLGGADTSYSPERINKILDCLRVTAEERERFNQAAARDAGFRIGWEPRSRIYKPRPKKDRRRGWANPYKVKHLKVNYETTANGLDNWWRLFSESKVNGG